MRKQRVFGYCMRTSRRVYLNRLVEDGELPGLLVAPRDADDEHPQKILKPLGPDLPIRRPAPPYASIGTTVRQGEQGDPSDGSALTNPTASTAVTGVTITVSDDAGLGYGVDGYSTGPWSQ